MGDDTSRWTQRVIIHCDDMASITRLGEAFVARGFAGKVVGIHDRYPLGGATDRWKRRSVPAPGQCDALIWIHQYKLLEGIDDHRFQVLAFFDVLQNVRSIVQQVGRVIRKSDNDTGLAWVLDHFGGRINRYWQLYKDFDKSVTPDELAQAMSKVLVKDFTDVRPPGHRQVVGLVWCRQDWSLWQLRQRTRVTGIRSRSSGTRCGCITVLR